MRVAVMGLLIVTGVFGGCLSTGPVNEGSDNRPDEPEGPVAWSAETQVGSVPVSTEPSIAVGPGGEVYVASPQSLSRSVLFPNGAGLWRSDDGGATFTQLGTNDCVLDAPACPDELRNPGEARLDGPGDAEIAVTSDSIVHWAGLFGSEGAFPYSQSPDRGVTWTELDDLAPSGADRQWLTARLGDGALFATWRDFENDILVRASYDSGTTWTDTVSAGPDGTAGPLAVHHEGDLLLSPQFRGPALWVYRSMGGTNWDEAKVADTQARGHIFPVAAIDAAGNALVVWAEDPAAPPETGTSAGWGLHIPSIYWSRSHDGGLTWSQPSKLNAEGTSGIFPWIVAGERGRFFVTWLEHAEETPVHVGGTWYVQGALTLDADTDATWDVSRVSTDPVRIGGICTSGGGCTTNGGDRSLLDFYEAEIGVDGRPIIVWAKDGDRKGVRMDIVVARMVEGPVLR